MKEIILSLRGRLSLSYTLIVLVVTGVLTAVAVYTASSISLNAQREESRSAVEGVAIAYADILANTNADPAEAARQLGIVAGGRIFWLGPDGRVRVDSYGDASLSGNLFPLPPELATGQTQKAEIFSTGKNWVVYAIAPLQIQGQPAGTLLLMRNLSAEQDQLVKLRQRLWLLGAVLALIFMGIGVILAGNLTQPLTYLIGAVREMQSGKLQQSVPAAGSGEIAELNRAFNDMAFQVAQLDQQRRAFIADAAHELRTPLASLHAMAEDMQGRPEALNENLVAFVRQTERLSRLVDSLLTLTRLDNPELKVQFIPLHVNSLINEVLWIIKPLAADQSVEIKATKLDDQAWVKGDPDLLHHALLNLLDNAIRYTPAGGTVSLVIASEAESVFMVFSDSGPGVAAEFLPYLGTRFFRPSVARERKTGGSGLGLAIVKEIVHLHEGELEITSPPGQGLKVSIALPGIKP